jgi:hypothetical protein
LTPNRSPHPKKDHNLVKMRSNWEVPVGRVRTKLYAHKEISDAGNSRSIGDLGALSPTSLARQLSLNSAADALYSFDRSDTPGRPLALDIFVKTTGRETEKLVQKEYEILDANGDAIKGRKARRLLRKTASDVAPATEDDDSVEEDEGFELV